jgi:hypothetical protein
VAISSGPRVQDVNIIASKRRFLIEFSPLTSLLSQKTSEILPSDGVIFYTDGSLCESRAGAGVFSDTLDIRESYALGLLATVFQTEVYAILACSDYFWSSNMHNMTICICSDSKAALLALSSYTFSLITTGRDCFGCQVTVTLRAMKRLIGWREWAPTPTSVDRSPVLLCQLQLSGI